MPRRSRQPLPALDPIEAARLAHLRYVSDDGPGIRRRRAGRGFRYLDVSGKTLRDAEVLARIKALVIPPAWRDVWICPDANGHIQATGRDARARKQYRYHTRWREVRDATKYGKMIAFGRALPAIRKAVQHDLGRAGLPREKVIATVVRLLETTLIRVGNEEYARDNGSFGLSTMRNRHVAVEGAELRFRFRGKSGKHHEVAVSDRRLARIVRQLSDLPGHEVFQYVDADGERRSVESNDINAYLQALAGEEFTAKDFRTWAGTVLAACALSTRASPDASPTKTATKQCLSDAVKEVATRLGNTPAVCRRCYVHPAIVEAFEAGTLSTDLVSDPPPNEGLSSAETKVLALLSAAV